MIDSGCTYTCIDKKVVKEKRIPMEKMATPMTAWNADGTLSGNKLITEFVKINMEIEGYKEDLEAVVTLLQSADLFLGHNWLVNHNPEIDWYSGKICFNQCPKNCVFPHQDIHIPPHF